MQRLFRKIFDPIYNTNTIQFQIKTNAEVRKIYNDSVSMQEMKSERLRCVRQLCTYFQKSNLLG